MAALRESVNKWEATLGKALQYDLWGQVVEAVEIYRNVLSEVISVLKQSSETELPHGRKAALHRFQSTLQMRLANLQYHSAGGPVMQKKGSKEGPGIPHSEMVKIKNLHDLILGSEPWPIHIDSMVIDKPAEDSDDDDGMATDNKGKLFPAPTLVPGRRYLKVHIKSIGLKDAMDYLDPFIAISLRSGPSSSSILEEEQFTPIPKLKRSEQSVNFEVPVFLITPIDDIPPNANLFFEFKHFKPKKSYMSVRCWSMLSRAEMDDEGPRALEIYAKPADYSAKKFHKHSNKSLYFNVVVTILENKG
eukprot:TRINITY_DN4475_c2_g1_i1.p1 TRINITY_DN4475_c2_g1~~TRINITY_DN4475_c2_g1_i1.p1  ORF type:complete len:304 (+),score=39.48 TRINITY_DN4475_c2_g1_i1:48-959(+)